MEQQQELSEHGVAATNDMNDNDMRSREFDVVVVGGGAAGLPAALVLSRARRWVAVVDAGAPRNCPQHTCRGTCPVTGCHHMTYWFSDAKRCAGTAVS